MWKRWTWTTWVLMETAVENLREQLVQAKCLFFWCWRRMLALLNSLSQ